MLERYAKTLGVIWINQSNVWVYLAEKVDCALIAKGGAYLPKATKPVIQTSPNLFLENGEGFDKLWAALAVEGGLTDELSVFK